MHFYANKILFFAVCKITSVFTIKQTWQTSFCPKTHGGQFYRLFSQNANMSVRVYRKTTADSFPFYSSLYADYSAVAHSHTPTV